MKQQKRRRRRQRKRQRNRRIAIWAAVVVLLLLVLAAVGYWIKTRAKQSQAEADAKKAKEEKVLEFPYELEDGKLVAKSLFQSDITNPDCNNEEGTDIASLELQNQSEEYLASAQVTVTLTDGTKLRFQAEDIPAGKSVWAFETGNGTLESGAECRKITCQAEFDAEADRKEDQLAFAAEGTTVTVTNLTDQETGACSAVFHCLFDENTYYGGIAYTYPVAALEPGNTTTLEVAECYLGTAEAVRVTNGGEGGEKTE